MFMKKNSFLIVASIFCLFIIGIYKINPKIDFYNTQFLHPLFWFLLPTAIFLFFCSFLKNIKPKYVFMNLGIVFVIFFFISIGLSLECSIVMCFSRGGIMLFLSSIFSVIYFILLLIKNRRIQ